MLFIALILIINATNFSHSTQKETTTIPKASKYQPLILVKKSSDYFFPTQAKKNAENQILYTENQIEEQIYACPAEILPNLNTLATLCKISPNYKFCLFKRRFDKDEKKLCQEEVMPILLQKKDEEGNHIECGPHKEGRLYEFAFQYCVSSSWILNAVFYNKNVLPKDFQLPKGHFFSVFSVCYNNSENARTAIYTQHKIMVPSILQNSDLREERENDRKDINMIDYDLIKVNENILKLYDDQVNQSVEMFSAKMVPRLDMAFSAWKNATLHYVNQRPLWNELRFLMNVIEFRIRRFAIEKRVELLVFTGTFDRAQIEENSKNEFLDSDSKRTYPVPMIWCKILYDEERKNGLAVLIHNTPQIPGEYNQLCTPIPCDIHEWNHFEEQLPNDVIQYAYCCAVTRQLMKLFSIELAVNDVLNLDNFFRPSIEVIDDYFQ